MLKFLKISVFVLVLSMAGVVFAQKDFNPYERHMGQGPITSIDLENYKTVYNKVIEKNDFSINLMKVAASELGTDLKRIDYLESKITMILAAEEATPEGIESNYLITLPRYMQSTQEEIYLVKNDEEAIVESKGGFMAVRLNFFKKAEDEVYKKNN